MRTNVDDVLRSELRKLAEYSSTTPSAQEVRRDVSVRVTRRRRRRRLVATACATAAVSAAVVTAIIAGERTEDLVVADMPSDGRPPAPGGAVDGAPRLTIERIEARGGPAGTEEVAIVFDAEMPDGAVTFVEDITAADTDGVAYTLQGASGLRVCGDLHDFPGGTGSVDLLLPAAWLTSASTGDGVRQMAAAPLESDEPLGKIVVCGPYNGYVQVSIWGPASNAPGDVKVRASDDRTRLIIAIRS